MKKLLIILLTGVSILSATTAFAQRPGKKFSFGIITEAGLPTGDAKQLYKFTTGLNFRLSFRAGPGFATLGFGGVAYLPSLADLRNDSLDNLKAGAQIPIKLGYKYIIGRHFFIMGEVGYSRFYSFYKDDNDDVKSIKSNGFTYAPSIGVQFGLLEIGVKYEAVQVTGGTISNVGVKLGFNF